MFLNFFLFVKCFLLFIISNIIIIFFFCIQYKMSLAHMFTKMKLFFLVFFLFVIIFFDLALPNSVYIRTIKSMLKRIRMHTVYLKTEMMMNTITTQCDIVQRL
jgi:hypothetical protein